VVEPSPLVSGGFPYWSSRTDVNTIGCDGVPSAISPPSMMNPPPLSSFLITTPGSIVRIAGLSMCTKPFIR
jgi:hypothetical protein